MKRECMTCNKTCQIKTVQQAGQTAVHGQNQVYQCVKLYKHLIGKYVCSENTRLGHVYQDMPDESSIIAHANHTKVH